MKMYSINAITLELLRYILYNYVKLYIIYVQRGEICFQLKNYLRLDWDQAVLIHLVQSKLVNI